MYTFILAINAAVKAFSATEEVNLLKCVANQKQWKETCAVGVLFFNPTN